MIRWILIALAAASPAVAQEQIRLRSGEHSTFSRIVLETPWSSDYALDRNGRSVRLRLSGLEGAISTSEVFRRMPRRRVADATFDAATREFRLRLACDCEVDVFGLDNRLLVIDVRDAGSRSAQPRNAATVGDAKPGTILAAGADSLESERADTQPLRSGRPETAPTQPRLTTQNPASDADLRAAQQALLQQLTRAVDQGLLEFAETDADADPALGADAQTLSKEEMTPELTMEQLAAQIRGADQIDIQTAIDRDAGTFGNGEIDVRDQSHCVPDADLMIENWATDAPFGAELGALRETLLGEFDAPVPDRFEALIRFYIHHGLGTEALAHMRLFDTDINAAPLLSDLALLLTGFALPQDGPLRKSEGCEARAGIWHAAAEADADGGPLHFSDALAESFADIPPKLRQRIGAKAIRGYLNRGPEEAVKTLYTLAIRPGSPADPAMRLTEAMILSRDGRHEEAEAAYRALAELPDIVAPEALERFIASHLARGADVPEDMLERAKSAAWLLRAEDRGHSLLVSTVQAEARANNLDAALSTIAEEIRLSPERAEMYRRVAAELVAEADPTELTPAEYSATVLKHLNALPEGEDGDAARLSAARALLDLALPDTALAILDEALGRRSPASLTLAAEAHLAAGRAHVTLQLIAGMGPDVTDLRARALTLLDQHAAAAAVYEDAVPEPLAVAGGDWERLVTSSDETRRGMAEFKEDVSNDPTTVFGTRAALPPAPNLDQTRSLIEQNRQTRETVEAMLDDLPASLRPPPPLN
ncbi:MAG: hypothetical protein AAFR40_08230 [Pseudomonadota bacterium]